MVEKPFRERRHPILCANCGTEMVGMNRYISSEGNILVLYVCPRRKKSGEKGCGYQTHAKLKKDKMSKEMKPVMDVKLIGEVHSNENLTMIIQDNDESFNSWLHHNRDKFKDKRVEVTVRIIE